LQVFDLEFVFMVSSDGIMTKKDWS